MVVKEVLMGKQSDGEGSDRRWCPRTTSLSSHRVTGTYPKEGTRDTYLHGKFRLIFWKHLQLSLPKQ